MVAKYFYKCIALKKFCFGLKGGFVVPEPSTKLLSHVLPKIGLLRSDAIRKVMDAYVLTEQYLDSLILLGIGAVQLVMLGCDLLK